MWLFGSEENGNRKMDHEEPKSTKKAVTPGSSCFVCIFDLRYNRLRGLAYLPMVILIAVPLAINGRGVATDITAESRAAEATRDWVEGTGYTYVSAQAGDGVVNVVIKGQGDLPPPGPLLAA